MESAWYNVERYLELCHRQRAAQLLDLLGVQQQAQNVDESSFQRYVAALKEQSAGPLDPELEQARMERSWARAAAAAGDDVEAKALLKHAEYLEFCHRHGIPTR